MKTYSHEHEAKIAHCVRTHKRFTLFFASKSCFFDLNQNTCFSSTQTGCRTTDDCLKTALTATEHAPSRRSMHGRKPGDGSLHGS